jgi:type IV pilus assembly protein PilB
VLKQPGYFLESEWYCGESCLREAVMQRLQRRKQPNREKQLQSLLRLKLGHILLESGVISREQLEKALEYQQEHPTLRLGSIVKILEYAAEREVTMALSRQFGLPVVKVNSQKISETVLKMVPVEIVQSSHFVPLEFDTRENALTLVTYDPADLANMINLRSILRCEVNIYLGDESMVLDLKDQFCRKAMESKRDEDPPPSDLGNDLPALANFIVERAKRLCASSMSVRHFDQFIWTRFDVERRSHDVVVQAA